MDRYADWVTIVPPVGELNKVAKILLTLADPREVLTQGNGTEFLIPPEVADAYQAVIAPYPSEEQASPPEPKRRGRAPKITETEA